jgi:D-serine deaminase-like pyridoxal phosphate-dependent protein
VTVALGALLAIAAVVLVALPFLREPATKDDRLVAPTDSELTVARLAEERDRALAALKELEFDHRTGKVTDEDYRALVAPLRQAAAAALKSLDERA